MRSVPACCCLSSGTEHSSSRAPRRAARAAQSEMRTQEGVRAEARTVELRAVAQLARAAARSPAPPCRRAPTHLPPPQYPARRNVSAASSGVASQSAMRTQEGVRAEARTMELRAVAQLGRAAARSPTPPCRRPAAAPAAPAAPCAPPYGRSNSAVAPQSRRRASDIALWRRACASPTLSMRALPARTPCGRHRNPSSEPAGGSLLPPPPPAARGAAAPSFRAGAHSRSGVTPRRSGRRSEPGPFRGGARPDWIGILMRAARGSIIL